MLGQTAEQLFDANPVTSNVPNAALERLWPDVAGAGESRAAHRPAKAALDLAGERAPVGWLCPTITIDREVDGERRLNTPDEMQQKVASLEKLKLTAIRLELAGALDDEMTARSNTLLTATRRRYWA